MSAPSGHSSTGRCGSELAALIVAAVCRSTALGLALNTASMVVILAIAAMGLNLLVGYYGADVVRAWRVVRRRRLRAAGLLQSTGCTARSAVPIILAMLFVAVLSTLVGIIILRRRGVYFSLLTLALSALTYTIAFRWTDVTGGEDGLERPGARQHRAHSASMTRAPSTSTVATDRPRRSVRAAARGALAVRARAGGDPREPAARDVSGLSGRALQARRRSSCRRW